MLIWIPPIFVADRKIIYGYNFVAPLKNMLPKRLQFIKKKAVYLVHL